MRMRIGPLLALVPLCCLVGCIKSPMDLLPKKAARPATNWRPDPKVLDQLAEETTLEGLKFRPPIGYRPFNVPLRSGSASGWIGSNRKDGTAGSIVVAIISQKAENDGALAAFLEGSLLPFERRYAKDWSRSSTARGKIADRAFLRADWSGTCTEGLPQLIGKSMHGIVFVAPYGNRVVQVLVKGAVEDKTSLPLCEASALTLRDWSDK
jgi:hypothetical protein